MRFGSVCSGIEAASVAWGPLGWSAAWFAEVDRAASDVLKYRFPHVTNHGDMTGLAAKVLAAEIEAPDILVGGTPCQGMSVAGLRGGMSDPRTNLAFSYVDLANGIDRVRRSSGQQPCIAVWENVPGCLTMPDNSFGFFLAALVGDDEPLEPGPRPESGRSTAHWAWDKKAGQHRPKWPVAGYVAGPERAACWRVIDAQFVGLAQRRNRVFVVASAREDIDPAAILLEFDGVRRDSAPRREAEEGVAGTLDARTTGGGFPGSEGACSGHVVPAAIGTQRPAGVADGYIPEVANCLQTTSSDYSRADGFNAIAGNPAVPTWWDGRDVSQTLDAVLHKGQTMPEKNRFPAVLQPVAVVHGAENVIAFSAKDYGGDASVGVSPTLRSMNHDGSHANGGGQVGVAYAIQERAVCVNPAAGPDADAVRADDCAYTLEARSVPQGVAYSVALRGRDGGGTAELGDEVAGALRASSGGGDKAHVLAPVAPAVCVTGSVTHTLKAEGFDASEDGTGRGQPIVPTMAIDIRNSKVESEGPTMALQAGGISEGRGMCINAIPHTMTQMAVRRLMPVECERLQGFPDNWTLVPTGKTGKPAADGPRYKQCGNSMATNVMHWIGRRIKAALPGDNGGPAFEDLIG